jgi:hypothetical protein
MNFTLTLVLGAFLLAAWFDARFEPLRPSTTTWRIVHVAASCLLLQIVSIAAGALVPDNGNIGIALVAIFALLLPVFVYTFVSALWLLRTLAEVGFARR